MNGSPTRSLQGPPGTRRAAHCVGAALALAAAGAAGCAASTAPPLPLEPPGAVPAPDPERLRDALDVLAPAVAGRGSGVAPDSFLAAALRASGLTPPGERRFRFGAPEGARIAVALVPGGHPSRRDSLVVAVAAGGVAQAALLEAAHLLNARAAYTQVPGRSVLVAFVPAGGAEQGGAALARVLALPLWASSAVGHVVWVGEGAGAAQAAAGERGLRFTAAVSERAPGGGSRDDVAAATSLALAAYEAIRVAARPPARPIVTILPADSTLVPSPDGR